LEAKPETADYFYRHQMSRGGLMAECKVCRESRDRNHDGYEPNTDETITKRCSVCYEEKPATLDNFYAHRYSTCGLEARCKNCRYESTDRQRLHAYQRQYYAERAELIQAHRREKQKNNLPEYRAMKAAHTRTRRARIAGNGGEHTAEDVQRLLEGQRHCCWWCGERVDDSFEVDHRIPISRGGTNDVGNLVISCWPCNRSKGNKMPHELDEPRLL
jgi:5-methylcytosine-specific restriction endonuclease McrA